MLLVPYLSGLLLLSTHAQGSMNLMKKEDDLLSFGHTEGGRATFSTIPSDAGKLVKRSPPTKWFRCLGKSKVKEETSPLLSEGGHAVFLVDRELQGGGGGERSQEVASTGEDTWEGQMKSLRKNQKHYKAVQAELAILQHVPGVPVDHDTYEEKESALKEEVSLFNEKHGLSEDGLLRDWSQMSLTQKHHGREVLANVYGVLPSYFMGREDDKRRINRDDMLRQRVKEQRLIKQAESGRLGNVPPLEKGYSKDLLDEYRREIDELQRLVEQRDRLRQDHRDATTLDDTIDMDIDQTAYQAVKSIELLRYKRDRLLQRGSYLLSEIRRCSGEGGSTSNREGTSPG